MAPGNCRHRGCMSLCATTRGCSWRRRTSTPRSSGWRAGNGGLRLRLDVPSPPLQFGRFHVELELLSADGGRLLHGLDRRAVVRRLSRRRRARSRSSRRNVERRRERGAAMSYKTCPDWPELMELAPDLQFKHMSVSDAQLPFDVVAKHPAGLPRRGRDVLRRRAPRVLRGPHRPGGRRSPSRARTGTR